jgi:hypothetical protein
LKVPAANEKFPVKQGINREFRRFRPKMSLARLKRAGFYKDFSANSLLNGTGDCKHRTGNFLGGTGNFQEGAGNLSKPAFFAVERSLSRRRESSPPGDWQEKG